MANPVFNQCPFALDICRIRGDTAAFSFDLKNPDSTDRTITGFTYLLTVDTLESPPDNTTQVFQLTGVEVSPIVTFTQTTDDADNLGDFFYDVEEIDGSSLIRTIIKGNFQMLQDITK